MFLVILAQLWNSFFHTKPTSTVKFEQLKFLKLNKNITVKPITMMKISDIVKFSWKSPKITNLSDQNSNKNIH